MIRFSCHSSIIKIRMYGKDPHRKKNEIMKKKTQAHFNLTQIPSSGSPLLSSDNAVSFLFNFFLGTTFLQIKQRAQRPLYSRISVSRPASTSVSRIFINIIIQKCLPKCPRKRNHS